MTVDYIYYNSLFLIPTIKFELALEGSIGNYCYFNALKIRSR